VPTRALVYVFPVQPADVTSFVDYHHDYPATDIMCPIGSRFVAPTSGVVDWVSTVDTWDPNVDDGATRGGLSVAIIGDDGVRYYGSHLSAVQPGIVPGVRVEAGQTLGKTGHSGDARWTDPHLHFGISHPTTPTDWAVRRGEISPYKYLLAWEAGRPLHPVLK
jgi:peptidoglycan LD-endopeptidase LytH